MWDLIEKTFTLAMILGVWVGIPLYVIWKIRSRRGVRRANAEAVDLHAPRVKRERVEQIEAEQLRDFHGPGHKGEPFIAPGGWWALLGLIASITIYYLAGSYFGPIVRDVVHSLVGS